MKKVNPVISSGAIDSKDIEIQGNDREIDIKTVATEGPPIAMIDPDHVIDSRKIDKELFMQDVLEVIIDPPRPKSSDPGMVYIGHELVPPFARWKPRGVPIRLKRFEVAILCQAKEATLLQTEDRPDADGFSGFIEQERLGISNTFQVLRDPNPNGGAWLREMLRNQA